MNALNFSTALAQRFGLTEASGASYMRHASARRLAGLGGPASSELAVLLVLAMGSGLPIADAIKWARDALNLRCECGTIYQMRDGDVRSQSIPPEWPREPLRAGLVRMVNAFRGGAARPEGCEPIEVAFGLLSGLRFAAFYSSWRPFPDLRVKMEAVYINPAEPSPVGDIVLSRRFDIPESAFRAAAEILGPIAVGGGGAAENEPGAEKPQPEIVPPLAALGLTPFCGAVPIDVLASLLNQRGAEGVM